MPKDDFPEDLSISIRQLSMHMDSTALELTPDCQCGLFRDLMDMSERLSEMADAIEDPARRADDVSCMENVPMVRH